MPVRILHIMGGMYRGGVETCLMNFLRKIDRQHFEPNILVHVSEECDYDQEIRQMGINIIRCPITRNPLIYAKRFKKVLKEFGPFDIIHSHVHQFSGYIFWLAQQAGVKKLIAHSHSNTEDLDSQSTIWRRLYILWMTRWLKKYAKAGFACSRAAARALYGDLWEQDSRWKILYCGIDFSPFKKKLAKDQIRKKYGIPHDAFVIGNVGRFTKAKNHEFLVEIYQAVRDRKNKTCLLLLGDGILFENIESKVKSSGFSEEAIFTGPVDNVLEYLHAMDIFVFPSLYEGLPLALLEAQGAGLPCLVSDVITDEAIIIPELVTKLALTDKDMWKKQIISHIQGEIKTISPDTALSLVEKSPFNIDICVKKLESVYSEL
jgi:glycosyltransferase involved in cell wall biosynthesis